MCLIVVAWRASAAFPLVVAANRDEWRDRPTEPARWWSEHPELLAGRDLRAGGTWMGITREGRFAAVTNFRDPSDRRSTARSRGGLVTEFLLGSESPRRDLAGLAGRSGDYNGFNLIVGDGAELLYFGSRESEARAIEPGVHGLSNHLLDEPWPKVVQGRMGMQAAIASRDPSPALFEMLSSVHVAPDADLPATGVGLEWERRLSSALIAGEDYGTRASTVLTVSSSGEVSMEERTRDAAGGVAGIAKEHFTVPQRGAVLHAAG
ncbi:MAG: NRDE family protein [Usitatibacter sp.]